MGVTGDRRWDDLRLARRLARAAPVGTSAAAVAVGPVPEVVRRFLDFFGVGATVGVGSFEACFRGRFLRPGLGWMPATAWQRNVASPISRTYVMRLRVGGVVPMVGYDRYLAGVGSMEGTVFGRTVADGRGPAFDRSELVTWLNDGVLLAPELLVAAGARWSAVDDHCFDVAIDDHALTVAGRAYVDDRGAPVDFTTSDRSLDGPSGPVATPWRTPITAWGRTAAGRPVPTRASATWNTPEGDLTYATGGFVPASVTLR